MVEEARFWKTVSAILFIILLVSAVFNIFGSYYRGKFEVLNEMQADYMPATPALDTTEVRWI